MRVKDVGEFGIIDLFRRLVPLVGTDVLVESGDDAAALEPGRGPLLFAVDALVEGVHFDLSYDPWESVGFKALASNLSDLAAMGGCSRSYAVVALGVREDTELEDLKVLQEGVLRCGNENGCVLVGGDLVTSPGGHFVALAVLGMMDEGAHPLTRRGSRAGDLILVTGTLGDAYLGRLYLKKGGDRDNPCARRHLFPQPRLREGAVASELRASAAIDVSDGFLRDLGHICEESGLGAEVFLDRLPLSREALELAENLGEDPYRAALAGGEDYELVVTAPSGVAEEICRLTGAQVVGEMVRGSGIQVYDEKGRLYRPDSTGYEHLR